MLRILGSESKLCDGLSRRDLLQIGGLGTLGLNVADWFALRETQAASSGQPSSFGKAKACILVFLTGSPPQHETFDPKPLAAAEIQGEMGAISSSVPGWSLCEGIPQHSRIMDRVTVVRSMTHPLPLHGGG